MKKSVLLIISMTLVIIYATAQKFDYSFKEVYKVTEPANLQINSDNSHIDVIAHDGNNIEVYFLVKNGNNLLKLTKEETAEKVSDQWEFVIKNTKDTLKITVLSTIVTGYINSEDAIDVNFKVYTPKQTSTHLRSSDGDISLKGLTSNQNCITHDGDIKMVDLSGEVFAQTFDGDIIIDNVAGLLDIHTNDGRIINLSE